MSVPPLGLMGSNGRGSGRTQYRNSCFSSIVRLKTANDHFSFAVRRL
jgi:hypothetical protein